MNSAHIGRFGTLLIVSHVSNRVDAKLAGELINHLIKLFVSQATEVAGLADFDLGYRLSPASIEDLVSSTDSGCGGG